MASNNLVVGENLELILIWPISGSVSFQFTVYSERMLYLYLHFHLNVDLLHPLYCLYLYLYLHLNDLNVDLIHPGWKEQHGSPV